MELIIKNKGTSLYTIVHPKPGKETIILLHGGPGLPDGLTFLREVLSRDFQIIMFHQRGTRKSPVKKHDYSLKNYISDVNAVAERFQLDKFHLFGHSWGGLYAQVYAQKHPDRLLSLFLCNPATGTGRQWMKMMLAINEYNRKKSSLLEWISMSLNAGAGLLGSNKAYRRFYQQVLINFKKGFAEAQPEYFALNCVKAKAVNRTVKAILLAPLLPEVKHPPFKVTIVFGDQDIFGASIEFVFKRYPTALRYIIPACGHIPWTHQQDEFLRVLERHYRR